MLIASEAESDADFISRVAIESQKPGRGIITWRDDKARAKASFHLRLYERIIHWGGNRFQPSWRNHRVSLMREHKFHE